MEDLETRKLASVRVINDIQPIKGADAIDVATVGGWDVVVKKNEFKIGDKIIYFEIDSWIPEVLAPFLTNKNAKTYKDIVGNRLKTIKLRGQISQGLILPLEDQTLEEGTNLTIELNIVKWEPVIPTQLQGEVKGLFPSYIPKTEATRIQNLELSEILGKEYESTEKIHGSSCTIYVNEREIGACSRNLDLKVNEENKNNAFVKVALDNEDGLKGLDGNYAIQGELIGPKLNGNMYKLDKVEFHVFKIWDIDNKMYLNPEKRLEMVKELGLKHVPILKENIDFTSLKTILKSGNGTSKLAQCGREGLVLKDVNSGFSFKIISNNWLLKNKE